MAASSPYKARFFNLHRLHGMSTKTMEIHFKLYEGYVREANILTKEVADFLKAGDVVSEKLPAYDEALRRLSYECNGMKLHEYYFENLKNSGGEESTPGQVFVDKASADFGSYKKWLADFMLKGKVRGVGWTICCANGADGKLQNHWISLHDVEDISCLQPLLVMDLWEHAFFLDYQITEREKYINDFFLNVDWAVVGARLILVTPPLEKLIYNLTNNFRNEI